VLFDGVRGRYFKTFVLFGAIRLNRRQGFRFFQYIHLLISIEIKLLELVLKLAVLIH
jgi:hypothetical protein